MQDNARGVDHRPERRLLEPGEGLAHARCDFGVATVTRQYSCARSVQGIADLADYNRAGELRQQGHKVV
jgi:hypothetical protein